MGCLTDSDYLYVILPYFNYCEFVSRRKLFIECVERLMKTPGIRVVVSEALGPSPLPKMKVDYHYKVPIKDQIWIKEVLVNMVVPRLPKDWKYLAWIDADITFLNRNWVKETKDLLSDNEVLQLFQTAVNLGPTGESLKIDKSFGYMYKDSGTSYVKNDKYGFWHPGYAWACSRKAWKKMGGLIDWAILGSADRHMAMAMIKMAEASCPGNIHQNYKLLLKRYEARCTGLRLSYVHGTILHHWHGSLANRKYRERWTILTTNSFDPFEYLDTDSQGLTIFTSKGQRLKKEILEYFLERKEDE